MESSDKIYNRAMIFSGGGTRFAMYCGMFAALEENGLKPDLILATCGGAIAATIIHSFQINEERKNYLQSEELFEFIKNTKLTNEKKLNKIGWHCLKLMMSKTIAPRIEDVFNKYLVKMPMEIQLKLPSLSNEFRQDIPTIMIGSQVLFDRTDTGTKRNGARLYRKILFTDSKTAQGIDCNHIQIQSQNYNKSTVDPEIDVATGISMTTAMRISISDMFYVEPVYYNGNYYMGGAIDLVPMELAQAMANHVISEKKQRYSSMEESLVRGVFGFSGNERFREIESNPVDFRVDTTDAIRSLSGHYAEKQIDWRRFQIKISLPNTFRQFIDDMEIQWRYGYEKIMQQLQK